MNTKTLLPVGRSFIQKASVSGTLRAAIIGPTTGCTVADTLRVVFWDASGRTAVWPLANVSNNVTEACCCLVQDRLVVAIKLAASGADFAKTQVSEFKLPTDPFTAAPSFVSQFLYGDADSRGTELVKLQSGEVVSVTCQFTDMRVCAAVRSVAGNWTPQGLFSISLELGTSHQFSCCAAPWASNELWVFDNKDGGHGCAAGIFNVVGGKLTLTGSFPVLIQPKILTGDYYWNGELVSPVATTDSKRGQICLSYTNTLWPPGTQQVAYPVVSVIKQNGVPVGLIKGMEGVRSILNQSPICVTDAGVALNWRAGAPKSNILVSGTVRIDVRDGEVAWNEYAQEFVYAQPDTGNIVLTILDAIMPPTPIPPPMENVQLSPNAYFTWSGADPTHKRTYWLQKGPSPTGPWTNVTDDWPYSFQAPGAKQQDLPIVEYGGFFYRLLAK